MTRCVATWSIKIVSDSYSYINPGICTDECTSGDFTTRGHWSVYYDGSVNFGGETVPSHLRGYNFSSGAILEFHLDTLTKGECSVSINGVDKGVCFTGLLPTKTYYPLVHMECSGREVEVLSFSILSASTGRPTLAAQASPLCAATRLLAALSSRSIAASASASAMTSNQQKLPTLPTLPNSSGGDGGGAVGSPGPLSSRTTGRSERVFALSDAGVPVGALVVCAGMEVMQCPDVGEAAQMYGDNTSGGGPVRP